MAAVGLALYSLYTMIICESTSSYIFIYALLRYLLLLHLQIRNVISDFGMSLAIILMVGISVLLKDKVTVETLKISDNGYDPTVPSERGWIINPLGVHTTLSGWAVIGAILPAILVHTIVLLITCSIYA